MADLATTHPADDNSDSDYGSDFSPEEDLLLAQLLANIQPVRLPDPALSRLTTESQICDIEDNPIGNAVEYEPQGVRGVRVPRVRAERADADGDALEDVVMEESEQNLQLESQPSESNVRSTGRSASRVNEDPGSDELDSRSPLERFRTSKRKGLTVTDLVSPAWCELQYWYTLSKFGKKRRTPAMKAGSKVHKTLEEQVYTTVKVEITTREDAWGLRIWNVIQGLRSLRETGLTRELEVWGTVNGVPVVGVIDELSNICPDSELEEEAGKRTTEDISQASIEEVFRKQDALQAAKAYDSRPRRRSTSEHIYLCDVKTRATKRLPTQAAFRPTKMQLMMYHHLLSELAEDKVDFGVFETLWRVDGDKVFSDAFIAQIGGLNEHHQSSPDEMGNSQDSMDMLLAHNSLRQLWQLMIQECQRTLPQGSQSLGRVLKVEYRGRDDGEVLGIKTFAMDGDILQLYLHHGLQWWQGEREAVGVQEDEAFKCQSCDFAETCEWRATKLQESIDRNRRPRDVPLAADAKPELPIDEDAEAEVRNLEARGSKGKMGMKKWSV